MKAAFLLGNFNKEILNIQSDIRIKRDWFTNSSNNIYGQKKSNKTQ